MARTICNSDKVIDSRDIVERINELTDTYDELLEQNDFEPEAYPILKDFLADKGEDVDDLEELIVLLKFQEDGVDTTSEWYDGATLIHESCFEEYCQDMLEDSGELPRDFPNYIVIDWEATCKNLSYDYSHITFDGETYLVRSC